MARTPSNRLAPRRLLVVGVLLAAILPQSPSFGATNSQARVLVHLVAPTTKSACSAAAARPGCADIVTAGDLAPTGYFAFVLVTSGQYSAGVGGVEFGIDYDPVPGTGVDIYDWTACSANQIQTPTWPASGSGNTIFWLGADCQRAQPEGPGTGVVAPVGYFYLSAYTTGSISITRHPQVGQVRVRDCENLVTPVPEALPSRLGFARFSPGAVEPGGNPCVTQVADEVVLSCSITGPILVPPNTAGLAYEATSPHPDAVFQWSVLGNGRIVGPTIGAQVELESLGPGAFELVVVTSVGEAVGECRLDVVVADDCTITGPDTLRTGESSIYAAPHNSSWTLEGSGTLLNGVFFAIVRAGAPGEILLTARQILWPQTVCVKRVIVIPACPNPTLEAATILVHLATPTPTVCSPGYPLPPCRDVVTSGRTYPPGYFAHILLTARNSGPGIAGARFGLQYDAGPGSGVDQFEWQTCVDFLTLPTPGWPEPGTGIEIVWDRHDVADCQRSEPEGAGTGMVVHAGYFYVAAYSPDRISVTPYPGSDRASIFDCDHCETPLLAAARPSPFGTALFTPAGTEPGYNPCAAAVPVRPVTWSQIKALFRG